MTMSAMKQLLRRLIDAAPDAWRQDRVFRGATIGVGITGALLLLRLAGPHAPQLQPASVNLSPAVPYLSGPGNTPSSVQPLPAQVPKIAAGQPLGAVTVVPVPDGDRFGTITPGKHP